MRKAAEEVGPNREIRVLVITGGNDGIFCSGGDVKYRRQVHEGYRESTLYFQRGPRCTDPTGKDVRTAISLDEFKRTGLRMGEFLAAETVPIADRLLKLTVDLGEERPSLVTGLARGYAPKGLHGDSVFPRSGEDSGGNLSRR